MTYDRAAIMRDAHKRFRDGKRLGLGWKFAQCLSTAWRAAKERRKAIYEELHPENASKSLPSASPMSPPKTSSGRSRAFAA
jgi:hypothetical protein